jgi:hypothetical protein
VKLKKRQHVPIRPKVEVPDTEPQHAQGSGFFVLRAALFVLVVPALVVVGYAALALQGDREDFPSKPMQTWPIGVSALLLAAALSWVAARPSRGLQPVVVVIALFFFFVAWASYLL